MIITRVKQLLQLYFDGKSSFEEEKELCNYFQSGEIDDEVKEYAEFFGGIVEISEQGSNADLQEEIMDYILEQEHQDKRKYRNMWQMVTGIAASVIIILGGLLFYQQQQKPFEDTFETPEEAYVQAVKALQLMGSKYQVGVDQLEALQKFNTSIEPLENMEKLTKASKPLKESAKTLNKGIEEYEKIKGIK